VKLARLWGMQKEYLKEKVSEMDTNNKNKNIRVTHNSLTQEGIPTCDTFDKG